MAVFTILDDREMKNILIQYNIAPMKFFFPVTDGVQNTTYLVEIRDEKYILTIYESGESEEEVLFFVHYVNHLRQKGVPCPKIYKTKSGQSVITVKDKQAVLVQFVKGCNPSFPSLGQCGLMADQLAKTHVAAKDFYIDRPNPYGYKRFLEQYHRIIQSGHEYAKKTQEELGPFIPLIISQWPKENTLPRAVMHLDVFPGNVFFEDQHVSAFIDFNFAATEFLLYDLGIVINAWAFNNDHTFNIERSNKILTSYENIRPLEACERERFCFFMKAACIRFLLSRLEDWIFQPEALLYKAKDPEDYFKRLDFHKIQQSIDSYHIMENSNCEN